MITKLDIEKELKADGGLKTKTNLTKSHTPEELFKIYKPDFSNRCEICGRETKFLNFKKGYDRVCSRECRKKVDFIPDKKNILSPEEFREFLRKLFTKTNASNKLNNYFFIKNNFIRELNTFYFHSLEFKIQKIYDFIHGKGKCERCGSNTTFINFEKGYRKYCTGKCSKIGEEPSIDFVRENFVVSGKFMIREMMEKFGVSESYVNKFKTAHDISFPNKREKYSYGESELLKVLNGLDVRTNDREVISPYEIDIVTGNLCIEYDGLMFHSDGIGFPGMNGKRFKMEILPPDKQLLTIFENEFLDKTKKPIWLSVINSKLGRVRRIFGRKCQIREISSQEARNFLESNHLQGSCGCSVRVGLFYQGELVSLMTFGKSRYAKGVEWELIRFASLLNTQVIGGASKLLKYFERNYSPESIISYANRRWSQGNLYEKLGFKFRGKTQPNYFYFLPNENILYSREQFQKHKLQGKLSNYFPNLSESENMFRNGYRKIYDYGNFKYVWTKT